jgi:membrane protein
MMLGAAVAYYSVFSLAPLVLTVVSLAGVIFGRQAVENRVQDQVQDMIGAGAAEQLQLMLKAAAKHESEGVVVGFAGLVMLFLGATGAFAALQDALNRVWRVTPDPTRGSLRTFLIKRVWSFGMIVGVVFLMAISLIVDAILAAVSKWFTGLMPEALSAGVLQVVTMVSSFLIIAMLFGAIFRVLPDAKLTWRDVWVGALLTSVLFTAGKTALGIYLGRIAAASPYGAASSLVLIVLWIYYACQIVLLGAEFTRVWTTEGRYVAPEAGAVKVT